MTAWQPELQGWTIGLAAGYEAHPGEAQLDITLLLWGITVWWRRRR